MDSYKIRDEYIDGIISHRNSKNVPLQKVGGKMLRISSVQMLRVFETSGKKIKNVFRFGILILFEILRPSSSALPLNSLVVYLSCDMESGRVSQSSLDWDRTSTAHRVKDYIARLNIGKSAKNNISLIFSF